MRDLIGWNRMMEESPSSKFTRPTVLTKDQWPPDYEAIWRWRTSMIRKVQDDPRLAVSMRRYYSTRPRELILDWMDTYDPRRQGSKWIPFVMFERQDDLVQFLMELDRDGESGLIEKCRDMGATWICCGYSVYCWLFKDDDATGWGSRKQDLVDVLGDPDSIFEKIRLLIKRLPPFFIPQEFKWSKHSSYMKLVNPENGSIIAGEAGDNIGRGGRKTRYFLDEAAHVERPEKVESALGDNTNVRIDISSVNGVGNVFHRRREHGLVWSPGQEPIERGFVRVFIMDWRDHPLKTQQWYDTRKAKYEREGMAHIFAQETERNYAAAISNTVIPYDWIRAAIDAHVEIPYMVGKCEGNWIAGLDVADDGDDRNAITLRQGIIWRECREWGERDPGVTARRGIEVCRPYAGHIECQYDCIGVGAGVKAEYNRLTIDEGLVDSRKIPFVPWNAGSSVEKPFERIIPDDDESEFNKDFFENLKAQAWWSLRTRFYKTFKARTEGIVYQIDELISLDSEMPLLEQLCKELAQPTRGSSKRLRMLIEKKPNGTRSPNLADSGVMAYYPLPKDNLDIQVGTYG